MLHRFTWILAATIAIVAAGFAPARASDLRVCADPNYLPFSNRAGAGFENAVARYVARTLGEKLVYYWQSTRGPGGYDQFVHNTLDKKLCDVLIDVPYANDTVAP
jgi:mxaJ protein